MVKFLIIRFSSIGDIVLTSPVIRCLKNQVENAELHYLTKKQFTPLLINNPYIDKIHTFDNNLNEIIHDLKKEKIDYIIDLHNNLRSKIIRLKLRLLTFSFNKLNIEKWLIVHFKINRLPDIHIVDRYMETLKLFDVKNDQKGLEYFIPKEEEVDISQLSNKLNHGYVAFVIGAKHNTKKLTNQKIISICYKINLPIILIGGKEDYENGEFITQQTNSLLINACGKFSLNQSASLIRQSGLVITHDTGFMHIAAAFKKKIISVWGNTIPQLGMYPYLPHPASKIFEVNNLRCRPCSKLGYQHCPKKHFKCIEEQDIEGISDYANKIQ